jgi:hypothetical protein
MFAPIYGSDMSVSVSPSAVSGISFGTGTVTSNAATVTVRGGVGPFTYLWTYVSGDTFTITSNTAASTTFSKAIGLNEAYAGVYRCTVTDAGAGSKSVDVQVYLQDNSYDGTFF